MDDMPDLSHLTPEERAIIEGVIMRQRQEEQREHEIMRRKQDEVAVLEQTIRTRNEMHRAAGVELAATCHICLKTKFADGVGHSCHYCRVRCCARCGGKVTLRSNKVIWVCILCRKKQELLSKTGQWIHKSAGQDSMLWQMESDLRGLPPQGETSIDKRPKLERAHSAAEKENLPLQRSGSALRRQYSQQEARCYGELEGLARTHPHLVHPRQKAAYGVEDAGLGPAGHAQLLPPLGPGLPLPPRSSSSDDEAPECVSDENDEYRDRGQLEACSSLRHAHLRGASVAANNYYNLTNHSPAEYLPEAARGAPAGGRSFDSVTDCRWRARDDGEGSYLRPYAPDGGPRPDRAVYKSAYLWEDSSDNRRFTERRKKTVRFDGHEGAATFPRGGRDASGAPHDWASLRWEAERQTSQDSATKDSGIDTSSTFTSSEDSNRGDCPKFPLNWQVSPDGTRMIGHMVLRKSVVEGSSHSSAAILGLKVVGGKILPDGTRGAIVEKVKKGSIADLEGQLKIGDEVLQWNGVPLQGRGADEVAAVVANSKHDSHVELVVSRPLAPSRPPVQCWRAHKEVYSDMMMGGCEKPSVLVTSPGSPDVHARRRSARQNYHNVSVSGRIQLKVFFDIPALQLLVTVVSATGLCPRSDGSPRCPYSKIFLLPDKSEKSKRRTKTLANTLEPRWNQTFVYCGIRISDLKKRTLEVTVWDLNRYGPNDFLGEVLLDLDSVIMNQEANWYLLKPHEEIPGYSRYRDDDVDGEHLSPPSTSTSRLSDSDTPSECDLRRHHSLSSLASSSSPPPPHEIEETRCSRRDMSPAGRVRTAGMSRERSGYVARSQSAAGGRSASPRRSLSPPGSAPRYAVCEERDAARLPTHAYAPRFQSRSATATPTTSPKKRQLPQIPHQSGQRAMRAQVSADLEERKWIAPHHIGATLTYRSTPQGWERHYAGLSDSELAARGGGWAPRRRLSPDAAAADSDLESVASVTSSAFSTQSERPRPTRMLRHPKKGLIQTDVNQDEELLAWDGHVKRLPKIPTYNGHYSQNSFSHYPNLVRTFEHPLPPNINAYSQSPPYASNHVDQEYSKMANSLSVGLSPTNLGSPRGVLTSVAPHLPSDDTHHNTTEATTYLPSAADSTRDEPKTSNTSNEERHDTSTAETDDTRPKTINSPDVECSNDYGGRENGRNHSQQPTLERRESRRGQFTRSLSNTDAPDEKTDGSLSDTALGGNIEIEPVTDDSLLKAEPRDFFGPGMGKKSNSTSQLSATGRKRRLGFGKRGKNSFTVQRSEEVVPGEMRLAGVSRASSASSENDDERWSPGMRGSGSSDGTGFSEFVDGLGPAQLIGRHILGSPPLGDIQLSLRFQKGFLEVEVIRARGLQARQGSRSIPAPYVKVYLVNGKKCFAKAKTNTARRTLDPLYQQTLTFRENLPGCILQVTVWGDYGRLEGKKVFMGVAQIVLDQLNLANIVIGWYKLFATTALVGENVAPATISSVQQ
ncbi:regulating synaptic membrane exocytosis protein 2-like isoform X9 [Bicyclus anynana]|uniref:Regulating synaptic membrane exocytosis protein 2-like isoform X9 n=1 Tax=Bicyclus anynana TaxID=110368 RepID=A0A6J1MVI1_BICAN|nr:regulating synaptic membrane exocytosis protein 2-like isoform X9 [Bicyclus anynana]